MTSAGAQAVETIKRQRDGGNYTPMPLCCCCHETEVDMLLQVCGHMVCTSCAHSLLSLSTGTRVRPAKCPICRKIFTQSQTIKMFFN